MSETTAQAPDATRVLEALGARPGGPQLLAAASRDRPDLALVGGAVRDLLLGREPRELDAVVDGDAEGLAHELAAALGEGAQVRTHGRFGTAVVEWPQGRIDLAGRRAESYAVPGALPDVRRADATQDLMRRDFTINAIAVPLGGEERGRLVAVEHAIDDLFAGRLRVLHERSFLDDPTRLLRMARYAARLRFAVEARTGQLAAAALRDGALETVSGARTGAELRLALGEADPLAALSAMEDIGVLDALGLERPDPELAARALALLPADGCPQTLLMALTLDGDAGPLLDRLEFPAPERDRILACLDAPALARAMNGARRPSQLRELLEGRPVEAVALAGAHGPVQAAGRWLQELRHVRLEIGGEDLLAAGLAPGPEIGRRLSAALDRRLDGELERGREAELRCALEGT